MTAVLAAVLSGLALVLGVAVLVVSGRRSGRARAVDRVRVPARSLSERWTLGGDEHLVEYPGPDGAPLRATIVVTRVTAPGQPYLFDGWVWVARDDPTDVVSRTWGRQSGSFVTMILGIILLVMAFGLGLTAGIVAFVGTLPS